MCKEILLFCLLLFFLLAVGYLSWGEDICYTEAEWNRMLQIVTQCRQEYQNWKDTLKDLKNEPGLLRQLREDYEKKINEAEKMMLERSESFEKQLDNMNKENKALRQDSVNWKVAVAYLRVDLKNLKIFYEKKIRDGMLMVGSVCGGIGLVIGSIIASWFINH